MNLTILWIFSVLVALLVGIKIGEYPHQLDKRQKRELNQYIKINSEEVKEWTTEKEETEAEEFATKAMDVGNNSPKAKEARSDGNNTQR